MQELKLANGLSLKFPEEGNKSVKQITLRIPFGLYDSAKKEAERLGYSFNAYVLLAVHRLILKNQ